MNNKNINTEHLTEEEKRVLLNHGTEMPFSGEYIDEGSEGAYNCKLCGSTLFSSDAKFDSGSGWPSFDQAVEGAVRFNEDGSHGMSRKEVTCKNCDGHLGHMFTDGPKETTGKRFCINSVCLDFEKREQKI
jgi:peptide-methionine (R)-S-oxide reductase